MPNLEIITIGTELLLGEITDTNSTYIARTLRDHGIDIYRITTIGDNPGRIAGAIQESLGRADIVITTGGLGPTVDDPTRQSVADATGRKLGFELELWEQIVDKFREYGKTPTENNRRQAFIPEGATPVKNPVGTAPSFIVELESKCIISLPGVPPEMKYILHQEIVPYLKEKYQLKSQIIKATVLHTASMGESAIDEIINDLEQKSNPTVGLLAHPGQVDIRVTAKAESEAEATRISKPVIDELRSRLGNHIYGQDGQTLPDLIHDLLMENDLTLCLIEFGLDTTKKENLKLIQSDAIQHKEISKRPDDLETFITTVSQFLENNACDIGFGLCLIQENVVKLHKIYVDSHQIISETRNYGGPPDYAALWAQNSGLDFLRRNLQNTIKIKKENHETS